MSELTKQSQLVMCYVHKVQLPRASSNSHHIKPRGAGGGNSKENIIFLCNNCHSILHRCEELVSKGSHGAMRDLIATAYPDSASKRERMSYLIAEAAKAFQEAEESGFAKDAQITISRHIFDRVQTLAHDVRDPNTGRPIGVARYVESLLSQHLRSKGYL